uniref:CSON013701 protein n=1 Tax=Culicoides sonorensis TaxID=179676 RepID=A0A336LI85_CULSO
MKSLQIILIFSTIFVVIKFGSSPKLIQEPILKIIMSFSCNIRQVDNICKDCKISEILAKQILVDVKTE